MPGRLCTNGLAAKRRFYRVHRAGEAHPPAPSHRTGNTLTRALLTILALMTVVPARAIAQSGLRDTLPTTVHPGDLIRITVWRNPELSGEFVVGQDGTISHPLYKQVSVVGIPLDSIESRIRRFLTQYEANPTFVATPLLRVFVGGEVRQPNVYTVPPGTTITQIVALAGGPNERGRIDQVYLARDGQRITMDLTRPDTSTSRATVRSGDQVIIGRARNVIQDVVAPSSSIIAAVAAIAAVIVQLTRH